MTTDSNETNETTTGLDVLQLRPCLLLAGTVSRHGGQSYTRANEKRVEREDGSVQTDWETTKILQDEDEFAEAVSLQNKCKVRLAKLGRHMPIGVIAAADKRDEIRAFRDEWRMVFAEFNSKARFSRVEFSLMIFEIAGENVQALEEVLDELRTGLADLERVYSTDNPVTMRDVIKRMTGFSELLPERVATTLDLAVKAAKKRAGEISRANLKLTRLQTKIAKELGPDADVQAELERLASAPLTADIRKRTTRLTELSVAQLAAADKLEAVKQQINDVPIRLARLAVQSPRVTPVEGSDEDRSAELLGANIAARVSNVERFAPLSDPTNS